jgi:hypothetical protein
MNAARQCEHRGFAMLTAIALVAVVGVAMAAAASVFRLDLRRTAAVVEDTQLRQLLIAGERAARAKLPAAPAAITASDDLVSLPPSLATRGASLTVRLAPGGAEGTATATVEAALAGRVMKQTLSYERGPAGWRLAAAGLHAGRDGAPG